MRKYILFSIILTALFLLLPKVSWAANWYVDNAVSSSGNGQSWATAWKSFSNIVWGSNGVKAGDTLYISGGTTGKTYSAPLAVGASGTLGSPITIRTGQDSGHTGKVTIDGYNGDTSCISFPYKSYITVNGEYNGSINLKVQNVSGPSTLIGGRGSSSSNLATGNIVKYVEVYNGGNGFDFRYSPKFEIDHCNIHGIFGDAAVQAAGCTGTAFGDNKVHHSTIDLIYIAGSGYGPDGIVPTYYCDIYNNIFRHTPGTIYGSQHQDYVQTNRWMRFYNNKVEESGGNSVFQMTNWGESDFGEYYIYNNTFQNGWRWIFSGNMQAGLATITNFKFYNNTVIDWYTPFFRTTFLTYVTINTGVEFKNNIFYNMGSAANPNLMHFGEGGEKVTNCSAIQIANNVVYSTGYGLPSTFYCNWQTLPQVNTYTGKPLFVNYIKDNPNSDLHLSVSDTVARDKGVPVTLPTGNTDRDGNIRGVDGKWDIGAYEYTGSPPSTYCGDSFCNGTETCSTCPSDCGVCSDTQSPSIPTNLSATAVSSSQINLSWIASTDNVGVTGYRIYRIGTQIGTSVSNSYSNIGLIANTTYSYTVSAYDAAGNVSAQSSSASATTLPPSANIEAESGTLTSPMQIISDSSASGGSYIRTNTVDQGTASYSFNIANAGVYKIIARVYAPDGASDSFYFKVDDSTEDTWDLNPTGAANEFNVWREDEVTKRGTGTPDLPQYDPYTVNLTAGNHTITFRGRETNARLDYFYLVKITDTTPPAAPSGVRVQ